MTLRTSNPYFWPKAWNYRTIPYSIEFHKRKCNLAMTKSILHNKIWSICNVPPKKVLYVRQYFAFHLLLCTVSSFVYHTVYTVLVKACEFPAAFPHWGNPLKRTRDKKCNWITDNITKKICTVHITIWMTKISHNIKSN